MQKAEKMYKTIARLRSWLNNLMKMCDLERELNSFGRGAHRNLNQLDDVYIERKIDQKHTQHRWQLIWVVFVIDDLQESISNHRDRLNMMCRCSFSVEYIQSIASKKYFSSKWIHRFLLYQLIIIWFTKKKTNMKKVSEWATTSVDVKKFQKHLTLLQCDVDVIVFKSAVYVSFSMPNSRRIELIFHSFFFKWFLFGIVFFFASWNLFKFSGSERKKKQFMTMTSMLIIVR